MSESDDIEIDEEEILDFIVDDEEVIIDFIGDDDNDNEIDSTVASTVLDAISNTLEDLDEEISFGIKPHSGPVMDWTEEYEVMFKIGDLVNKKGYDGVYKVVGFGHELHDYEIKKSCSDMRFDESGCKLKLAPKGAVWQPYTDTSDPFKVPGLIISCPSNNMKYRSKK